MNSDIETVLFDLDGTLLDTHLDMCAALNIILTNHGKPVIAAEKLRPFVSKGAMVMICLGFECRPESGEAKALWREMIAVYEKNIAEHTALFPGMADVLEKISRANQKWGIVTNKPEHLTKKLLDALRLPFSPDAVVSGDTLKVKKPDPLPLLYACEQIQRDPGKAVYIGDDEHDIIAGKAAGMRTLAASYGYIVAEEEPEHWGADGIVAEAKEILPWI